MAKKRSESKCVPDIDLVNIVNDCERFAWMLKENVSSEEEVNLPLIYLSEKKENAVKEIKRRTGYTKSSELKRYINEKLEEQKEMWAKEWDELSCEGSVFWISGRRRFTPESTVFETVRSYLPLKGTVGPGQYLMARVHGESETGKFRVFDERDIERIEGADISPMYEGPSKRGIVRYDEKDDKRIDLSSDKGWGDFCQSGLVFSHAGFDDVFETYARFNLFGVEQSEENEVILARPYNKDPVFYEFAKKDLGAMTKVPLDPRYHKERTPSLDSFRFVDLYSKEKL